MKTFEADGKVCTFSSSCGILSRSRKDKDSSGSDQLNTLSSYCSDHEETLRRLHSASSTGALSPLEGVKPWAMRSVKTRTEKRYKQHGVDQSH